jgi:ABC-2 type transport system ATP-binding protein
MQEPIIKVENVSMMFNINNEKIDNMKEYFIKLITRKLHFSEFWALRDISFTVNKGERLGVLGLNGAGKSTLLKVMAGVMKPTEGSITIKGVIAPLLELGAGFDMNYSGKENVFLYGATMGFSRKFVQTKYDYILDFSELHEFIDVPVKNFSSGMRARLGFAIATAVEPQILILDEVLSVGDARFRIKSEAKITSMFERGITVIFVSHNTDQVRRICNKAILLEKGRIIAQGTADEVCDIYDVITNKK